ncbi:MAG: hypothetical protein ACKN9T_05225 [Candidatus Methylumidiphilus sp.]
MTTVTHQGEVKIPPHLLKALGISPGAEVDFEQRGEVLLMRVVKAGKQSRVEDGPKILNYVGRTVTLAEMDEAIGKGAGESL